MTCNKRTLASLLAATLLALGLAACGGGGDGSTSSEGSGGSRQQTVPSQGESSIPTIVVRRGEPVGGVQELEYSAGEEVRFRVRSDVADEVHVHGYDVMEDVKAGGTASFDFSAEIEGIFEVELEERAEQIAELRVNP